MDKALDDLVIDIEHSRPFLSTSQPMSGVVGTSTLRECDRTPPTKVASSPQLRSQFRQMLQRKQVEEQEVARRTTTRRDTASARAPVAAAATISAERTSVALTEGFGTSPKANAPTGLLFPTAYHKQRTSQQQQQQQSPAALTFAQPREPPHDHDTSQDDSMLDAFHHYQQHHHHTATTTATGSPTSARSELADDDLIDSVASSFVDMATGALPTATTTTTTIATGTAVPPTDDMNILLDFLSTSVDDALPVDDASHYSHSLPHSLPAAFSAPQEIDFSYQPDSASVRSTPSKEHRLKKQRKRKDTHNAIERRRRYTINDRITELGTLLPASSERPSKGTILTRSVAHMRHLMAQNHRYTHQLSFLRQHIPNLDTILAQMPPTDTSMYDYPPPSSSATPQLSDEDDLSD